LKVELLDLAVIAGWAVAITSIIVNSLYVRPLLTWVDIVLLFVASAMSGMMLVDLESVVVGFVVAFALATVMTYILLCLPTILGISGAIGEVLSSGAVVMVFRSIFPVPFILILIGGFFGSFLGEKFRTR